MIYLSSAMRAEMIGRHPDIGVMVSYRINGDERDFRKHLHKTCWGADNGCYSNPELNVDEYLAWLKKSRSGLQTNLFATAPDVVGDADRTWERSKEVLPEIRELGYRAAFVAQDGMEDTDIQWPEFDVLFIGGTTEWKLSEASFGLMKEAKLRDKWVHVGRVNSRRRIRIANLALADSVDGTTIAFSPDRKFEQLQRWMNELKSQPFLEINPQIETR